MSKSFSVSTPALFSFELCMDFLRRSPKELLHRCDEDGVVKALHLQGEDILFRVTQSGKDQLSIRIVEGTLTPERRSALSEYVNQWFDLRTDLNPFYKSVKQDPLLGELVRKYRGYRIVGQPDLYESLVWAVLGQQINLSFAYTLKGRFVETYGRKLHHDGQDHYIFPSFGDVAQLDPLHLLPLQFSRQKAQYTVNISKAFAEGQVQPHLLSKLPLAEAKEELMRIKGVGNWTANYALMKTFRYPDAFPLEDAGLHNAIRNRMGLVQKPTLGRVKSLFKKYRGWEAYATLYLWRSL